MTIVLVVPDGVGIRNFVLTPFLRHVIQRGRAAVLHVCPEQLLGRLANGLNGSVEWRQLLPYSDRPLSFTLRNVVTQAHMCWANTRSMRFNRQRRARGSWRTQAADIVARTVGRAAASPPGIAAVEAMYFRAARRLPEVNQYRELFRRWRPSVVFCSHQRPPDVLAPVLAARSLGIPTAGFIFSWDNLTSKGRIAAPFDHYFVWSDHMRREFLRYYPNISPHRIHITGTPQFDAYADNSLIWTREEFFRRVGAEPERPLLCYSGGDNGTCPEDPKHLRILMDLIRRGEVRGNPQVLLRPCPVDDGSRYAELRRDYLELIYAPPAWVHSRAGAWNASIPLPEDMQLLANLTLHADLNVNVASTMTLDFGIRNKPVVNIAFDVDGPPLVEQYYQWEHYRPVVELGAVRLARSPNELARNINRYLEDPSVDEAGRRKLVELQLGMPLGQSSARIAESLASIAS